MHPRLFLAALDSSGSGSTTPMPFRLPVGFMFHCAAFDFPGVGIGEITDVQKIVVSVDGPPPLAERADTGAGELHWLARRAVIKRPERPVGSVPRWVGEAR